MCTQYVWAWVNFVHNLRCLLKNLRSQQNFYATAGPTGPDKYELWMDKIDIILKADELIFTFARCWVWMAATCLILERGSLRFSTCQGIHLDLLVKQETIKTLFLVYFVASP